ncbi:hypothetical protein D9757_001330 [Collybiopsis confluens]|uniref:Uncharacterized protein n=1 Tax=Collybiopsis confluens TaxID=2823264 RepID=A0A8H5MGN1_9AGAR|nr:hypothetical protein D9757_001330 [Collybiopsis confluens]
MADRSHSRGRDLTSSGRGGLGNIHNTPSAERPEDGPDDFSATRGKEFGVDSDRVLSTGRGGAGNIRSPSRDTPASNTTTREEIESERNVHDNEREFVSTGRGGLGNMSRSRSRGPETIAAPSSPGHGHGVSNLLHKVLRPHEGRDHNEHHHHEKEAKEEDVQRDAAPVLNFGRADAK